MGSCNTSKVEEFPLLAEKIGCHVAILFRYRMLHTHACAHTLKNLHILQRISVILCLSCSWCFPQPSAAGHRWNQANELHRYFTTFYPVNDHWSLPIHLDICRARCEHVWYCPFRSKWIPFQTSAEPRLFSALLNAPVSGGWKHALQITLQILATVIIR